MLIKALLLLSFCTAATGTDPAAQLAEAQALAMREESEAAIEIYVRLLEAGGTAAGLHYNLGTLYLEQGDVGRAVLHLKAALRNAPGDDDARHNLEVALAGRADQLLGVGPGLPWWQRVAHATSPALAQTAFLLPFALFLLLLASAPWTRRRWWRPFRVVMLATTVCTLAFGALLGMRMVSDAEQTAVVLEDLSALKGPDDDAAIAFSAHTGLSGSVRAEEAGYLRLRLDNGVEAWFLRSAVGYVE